MSLLSFLEQLGAADASAAPTARRGAMAQLGRTAAAALPAVLLTAATATPALAQRTGTVLDALQLALRVEWLQDEFYGQVLGATGLVPAAIQPDFTLIRAQQRQHIALLESYIRTSGGIVETRPRYDFTGSRGGASATRFPDVLTNTDTMLAVAQALEDLSTRVYTGQVALVASNNDLMDMVVRMFAVEGRHAAHLRQLRRQRGATVKHWISGTDNGGPLPPNTAGFYAGEDRVEQRVGALIERNVPSLLPATIGLTEADKLAAATEAFDEPLTAAAAAALIGLFAF
ncbi:ferritin-like domain-containing protein [Hymenobacter gummosus]|nr:ferritin-like domain-containing protein [Hymenobacter gummosus]